MDRTLRRRITLTPSLRRTALELIPLLPRGEEVFLVGGSIRDLLLGRERETVDLDMVCQDPRAFARALSARLGLSFLALPKGEELSLRAFATDRDPPFQLDLSPLRGGPRGLKANLSSRDFTANAMAVRMRSLLRGSLEAEEIEDPFGGRVDLARGILRPISLENLRRDPVRLLRAARLCAELGLKPSGEILSFCEEEGWRLKGEQPERISQEVARALLFPLGPGFELLALALAKLLDFGVELREPRRDLEELGRRLSPESARELRLGYLLFALSPSAPKRAAEALLRLEGFPKRLALRALRAARAAEVARREGGISREVLSLMAEEAQSSTPAALALALLVVGVKDAPRTLEELLLAVQAPLFRRPLLSGEEAARVVGKGPATGRALKALLLAQRLGQVKDREEALAFLEGLKPQDGLQVAQGVEVEGEAKGTLPFGQPLEPPGV